MAEPIEMPFVLWTLVVLRKHVLDGYWTTRGYANSRIAKSRTGRLAHWTYCGLVNSRTRQLAYGTSHGLDNSRMPPATACIVFVLLATYARPRVVQSATCPVRELAIRELAYPRVLQLPIRWGHTGAIWPITLNHPCAAAMRPFVKLP